MKLTITEIAKLAGVSKSTVSKIINNYDDIGPETRGKVLKIMEEYGYRPTYSAQSLAKKVSNVIGVIYAGKINSDLNHPFFTEVLNAFKKVIGVEGFDLLLFSNERFNPNGEDYLARCRHYNVDGCLIIAGSEIEPSIKKLDESDIPCIGVDLELVGGHSAYIMTDNEKISSLVVDYLYMQGHREVAFIGGLESSSISEIRLAAFEREMASYGLTIKPEWIKHGDFFEQSGYEKMTELLKEKDIPRAIFAASDLMALGAIKAIKDHGYNVNEFAIVGCDDILAARYSDPPLTTVKQDKEKIGRMAAMMLKEMIKEQGKPRAVKVDPELVIRSSVAFKKN
ncbi:LacI family transcriptional regulator [Salipaludibacillus sp. LMS25]|uniref:LacI family DNA-binding transcriptional regulator n=1 Tax=Salipaludibacillus sp. LMS25 TaxID=2924031 RepID=UPI0020D05E82|nr:LacI family DNA-binding transcriptional regulator [Salipaludibacillus sp. LMS25]UTR13860.1 LacI family transcriptional regulator [Salipaludibacillus sp. LMS25]